MSSAHVGKGTDFLKRQNTCPSAHLGMLATDFVSLVPETFDLELLTRNDWGSSCSHHLGSQNSKIPSCCEDLFKYQKRRLVCNDSASFQHFKNVVPLSSLPWFLMRNPVPRIVVPLYVRYNFSQLLSRFSLSLFFNNLIMAYLGTIYLSIYLFLV